MSTRLHALLLLVSLSFLLASEGAAFALHECDGDDVIGDAAILLGWPAPTATSIDNLTLHQGGAPASGISTDIVLQTWVNAFDHWAATSDTDLTLPTTTPATITPAQIDTFLSTPDTTRMMVVVTEATARSDATTGWQNLTGTLAPFTFGVTSVIFSTETRQLLDADIFINDDGPSFANQFFAGAVEPGKASLRAVIEHEFGHFLGAGHTPTESSLMFASLDLGVHKTLTEDDRDVVRFLHPTLADPPQPENSLAFVDCFTVAATGEILAASSPGGCELVPGSRGAAASALGLLWVSFFLLVLRRTHGRHA